MTLTASAANASGFHPLRRNALLQTLQAEIDRGRLPGAVVVLARHGQVNCFESLGVQNPATGEAMKKDSIFRLFSMTKPIVSVAIMRLLEQGRLLLSDPVAQYLPEFVNQQVAIERNGIVTLVPVTRPSTIQDLLRHTAGLTYEFSGESAVQRLYIKHEINQRMAGRDSAASSQALAAIPLMDQPGTVGEYSRATDVLGRVVEVISGQSLGLHLSEHIFAPLGMTETRFYVPPSQQHRIAQPFDHDPDGGLPLTLPPVDVPPSFESGGGGLLGTAHDYARFLQMMLNRGELDGVRLLAPHMVDFMTCDHLGNIPGRDSLIEAGEGVGLGFAVRTARGQTPVPGPVGTYYWSGMAGTSFFVDPTNNLFAMLLIQAPNQRAYYRQLFRNLVYACVSA